MIRDRDRIYGAVVTRRLRAMGIRDKPIAAASPWQNGFAERLIGSIRRECLDCQIAPKYDPLFAAKNDPFDGAETGGAEPHIAEQSRSWRAAGGERAVMRGS
jgi:transposase InsO family protein